MLQSILSGAAIVIFLAYFIQNFVDIKYFHIAELYYNFKLCIVTEAVVHHGTMLNIDLETELTKNFFKKNIIMQINNS